MENIKQAIISVFYFSRLNSAIKSYVNFENFGPILC
jgi:hypothetical protein